MNRFDVELDLTPLVWSPELKNKVRRWADRKPFGVVWHVAGSVLLAQYTEATPGQKDKATRSLCAILRREKQFAAAQNSRLTKLKTLTNMAV
jgi:hypothetical protein